MNLKEFENCKNLLQHQNTTFQNFLHLDNFLDQMMYQDLKHDKILSIDLILQKNLYENLEILRKNIANTKVIYLELITKKIEEL